MKRKKHMGGIRSAGNYRIQYAGKIINKKFTFFGDAKKWAEENYRGEGRWRVILLANPS